MYSTPPYRGPIWKGLSSNHDVSGANMLNFGCVNGFYTLWTNMDSQKIYFQMIVGAFLITNISFIYSWYFSTIQTRFTPICKPTVSQLHSHPLLRNPGFMALLLAPWQNFTPGKKSIRQKRGSPARIEHETEDDVWVIHRSWLITGCSEVVRDQKPIEVSRSTVILLMREILQLLTWIIQVSCHHLPSPGWFYECHQVHLNLVSMP